MIYVIFDLWLYIRFVGEIGCGKERKGGLSEEKVEIVKICIYKKE